MAKLKLPLNSLEAFGQLAKSFVVRRSSSQLVFESKPIPKDARTSTQLAWRTLYQLAVSLWHSLSPSEQQQWESQARPRHMSGFAWFLSQALRPNPGIYLPLLGGTMQGDIDMDHHDLSGLDALTVGGVSFLDHSSLHEWNGADQLAIYSLMPWFNPCFINFQSLDMWTQSVTGSASHSNNIMFILQQTGTTQNSIAKSRTSGNSIPPYDGLPCIWSFSLQNYGTVQSASVIWCAIFRNSDSPSDTGIHVGWKVINGRIYATNGNGSAQTITDTGDTGLSSSTWAQRRLSSICTAAGTMNYYIGNTLVATHTTNLPTLWSSAGRFILQIENTSSINQLVLHRNIFGAGRYIS